MGGGGRGAEVFSLGMFRTVSLGCRVFCTTPFARLDRRLSRLDAVSGKGMEQSDAEAVKSFGERRLGSMADWVLRSYSQWFQVGPRNVDRTRGTLDTSAGSIR